ncbi:hypothetical protein GOP47_0015027 [Adiantum capillus-veneris]|uniref:Pentatricopeptide repeat-containing protein n=1 Tax=Adiantum capillus-veneris TaxID=13818 RepID=A0A9D4UML6_ADICA|nr:hypothetical protein GOP47_0015027 [Adiantum capillus-veneris]
MGVGVKSHAATAFLQHDPPSGFGHGFFSFLKEILDTSHAEQYHLGGHHSPPFQNFGSLPASDPPVLAEGYESLLQKSANEKAAPLGRRIHAAMVENCQDCDKLLCNLTLRMYGKCGSLLDALACFSSMGVRNVFSWAILIDLLVDYSHIHDAIFAFQRMLSEGILPDMALFVSILSACSSQEKYCIGRRMHASIIAAHFLHDIIVGTALISMYCRCKCLDQALMIHSAMPMRNVVSWNAMIAARVEHDLTLLVSDLIGQMQMEGVFPDEATHVCVLNACAAKGAIVEGKQAHISCLDSGLAYDLIVGTALINMYGKCGELELARMVFELLAIQDVVSWSAMISAAVQCRHSQVAIKLFCQMKLEGVIPNLTTASSILDCCVILEEGKRLHAYVVGYSFHSDTALENSLLKMYRKCGDFFSAHRLFDRMVQRNVVSWTEIVKISLEEEGGKGALTHFQQMLLECVFPDHIMLVSILDACAIQKGLSQGKQLYSCIISMALDTNSAISNALVNLFISCDLLKKAKEVVLKSSKHNLVAWSCLISACSKHKSAEEVLHLLSQMEVEGVMPDRVCVISALEVCACHAALAEGKKMHYQAIDMGLDRELVVGTALVTMYGKCGSLEDAQMTFDRMLEHNAVTWNVMIGAHSHHGHVKESLRLYEEMQRQGFTPDQTTYHSILSACRYAGLLDEGCQAFFTILQGHDFKVTVEHFNSLVDLFTRAGLLDEGECMIRSMPLNPDGTTWMTLLGACEKHLDVDRGTNAAEHALKLDPLHAPLYPLISNIYAAARRWDNVAIV